MPGDPYVAPDLPEGTSFRDHAHQEPGKLRIAVITEATVPGVVVHPDCRAAVESAAELLGGLGHQVELSKLPTNGTLGRAFPKVWTVLTTMRSVAPEDEDKLMPLTRHLRAEGAKVSGHDFGEGLHAFRSIGRQLASFHKTYDVILTPTLAQPPQLVGGMRNESDPAQESAATIAFSPFTALYNVTGQPAVSLPLYWTPTGIPIGVMAAARYGDDATLISLSAQLEAASPWSGRKPGLW